MSVAVLEVGQADAFQRACFLRGSAEVAGDGQRPDVVAAGLPGCPGPGR